MKKTELIQFVVTPEQKKEIEDKAEKNNLSVPDYLRLLCKGVKLK